MGRPKPDRNLSHLHPLFRREVEALSALLEREGLPFRFYEGLRGPARQSSGYSRGKSKARFGQSWHNYGMAADFVANVGGRWSWDNAHPWREYGEAVESMGLTWSGRWESFPELVHCQHKRFRLADLRMALHVEHGSPGSADWLTYMRTWWPMVEGYGPGVAALQRLLVMLGLDPGPIDGHEGPKTLAAAVQVVPGDLSHAHRAELRRAILARVAEGCC